MARIGIDLDGVLYDFGSAFRAYLVNMHSWQKEWCPDAQRWEFYEDWGISLAGFVRLCNEAADRHMLWDVENVLGGRVVIDELARLKDAGHSIHVITNRSFGSHRAVSHMATAGWLNRCKVPYDTLTFSADKTIVPTDFMVEDNVDNYLALDKSGCHPVLIDRTWNQSLPKARRVPDIKSFVDLVLKEAA